MVLRDPTTHDVSWHTDVRMDDVNFADVLNRLTAIARQ
jgi:hypothetical protein